MRSLSPSIARSTLPASGTTTTMRRTRTKTIPSTGHTHRNLHMFTSSMHPMISYIIYICLKSYICIHISIK